MRQAPGPSGIFDFVRLFRARKRSALGTYRGLVSQYGDFVSFGLGSLRFCLINDAEAIKHVTQDNHANYTKGTGYNRLKPIIGNGLITSEGEVWRRHRRMVSPSFLRGNILAHTPTIQDETRKSVAQWLKKPGEFDLSPEIAKLSFRVSCRILFGIGSDESDATVFDSVSQVLTSWGSTLTDWLRIIDVLLPSGKDTALSLSIRRKTGGLREFDRAMASLDEVVASLIQKRRSSAARGTDVLSLLMQANETETREGGTAMDDRQLRDEVMTFLIAGYESTASALLWTFYLLDQNPEWEQRFIQEMTQSPEPSFDFSGGSSDRVNILSESMRLYPPIWRVSRCAIQDDEVMGVSIPKGTTAVIPTFLLHRHPKYWPNPDHFDPNRFKPEASQDRPRFAYAPFGLGPRTCIGMGLAIMDMQIMIAEVLAQAKVQIVNPGQVEAEAHLTLRPKGGLKVRLTPRQELLP